MKQNVICILASGSPRRRELLQQAGLSFEILVSEAEENTEKKDPGEMVMELSSLKGKASAGRFRKETDIGTLGTLLPPGGGVLIIAADTLVFSGGQVLGKPKNGDDALMKLMALSGKPHAVYTGVYLELLQVSGEGTLITADTISFYEKTEVEMFPFSREEALDYIATGEPLDKAGAYGIQGIGARLVKGIRGDYNNVVGFPLARFLRVMAEKHFISYT